MTMFVKSSGDIPDRSPGSSWEILTCVSRPAAETMRGVAAVQHANTGRILMGKGTEWVSDF